MMTSSPLKQLSSDKRPASGQSPSNNGLSSICDSHDRYQCRLCAEASSDIRLKKGQVLSDEAIAKFSLIHVISGLVKVAAVRSRDETRTVGFFFPGEIIALKGWQSTAELEIEALLASQIEGLHLDQMSCGDHSTKVLLEILSQQVAREQRARLAYAFGHIDERLAALMLQLFEVSGGGEAGQPVVNLPMRRNDIADYLGIRMETLSRHLSNWTAIGLIALPSPRKAVLLDRASLESIVSRSVCCSS